MLCTSYEDNRLFFPGIRSLVRHSSASFAKVLTRLKFPRQSFVFCNRSPEQQVSFTFFSLWSNLQSRLNVITPEDLPFKWSNSRPRLLSDSPDCLHENLYYASSSTWAIQTHPDFLTDWTAGLSFEQIIHIFGLECRKWTLDLKWCLAGLAIQSPWEWPCICSQLLWAFVSGCIAVWDSGVKRGPWPWGCTPIFWLMSPFPNFVEPR
jgi:hypothetical protein